jgi:hypothetical protein
MIFHVMLSGARHAATATGSRQAWYTALRGALIILETRVLARLPDGSVILLISTVIAEGYPRPPELAPG